MINNCRSRLIYSMTPIVVILFVFRFYSLYPREISIDRSPCEDRDVFREMIDLYAFLNQILENNKNKAK
jgi:hypothetical protein